MMLRNREVQSSQLTEWTVRRTVRFSWASLLVFLLPPIGDLGAQRDGAGGPPHYPTATEQLPATLPHPGIEITELRGTVFNDAPVLGRPGHMLVQDDLLWVTDRAGDPYLHMIELPSGRLVTSRGRAGEGPGDFRNVMQLSVRPGDLDAIWAYDFSQRRLTRVAIRPQPGLPPVTITGAWKRVDASLNIWSVVRMFWLDNQRIAALGHTDSNRVMILDTAGAITATLPGPLLGPGSASRTVRESISKAVSVCVHPGGGEFVVAYANASRADLFDSAGRYSTRLHTPIPNRDEGDLHRDAKGVWHNPMPRYYYRSCATTENRIYLLFAGRLSTAGPEGTRKWDAQFIHVFDWSGNLLAVYQIDQFAGAIAVADDAVLYAAGGAMEAIYRYPLPRLQGGGM